MKLDPGMHIGLHLVFFGKSGVTISHQPNEQADRCRTSCSLSGARTGSGASVTGSRMAGAHRRRPRVARVSDEAVRAAGQRPEVLLGASMRQTARKKALWWSRSTNISMFSNPSVSLSVVPRNASRRARRRASCAWCPRPRHNCEQR
jgi:hypothetical protein